MSEIIIPSSIEDRRKLQNTVRNLADSMVRQKSESDYQRETIKEVSKEIGVGGKHIRQMAKDFANRTFEERVGQTEEYCDLYETIMKGKHERPDETEDGES